MLIFVSTNNEKQHKMTKAERDKKLEIMRLRLIELCNSKKVGDGSKQIKEIHALSKERTLIIEDRSK